jgi:trehalose synthase
MRQVDVGPVPLSLLAGMLTPDRAERLNIVADRARKLLEGRVVWNISSTAQGGGVAEMLQTLLAYGQGAGVDTRWLVLSGDPEFFAITKRLHNLLHGSAGDGGDLGKKERAHYERVQAKNFEQAKGYIRSGDIVLLHDPQPAGMVSLLQGLGAHVVWRCHIGRDSRNEHTDSGWEFLRDFIVGADGFVFSRVQYAQDWLAPERVWVIPPSLDPFSAKNEELSARDVNTVLRTAGLVDAPPDSGSMDFVRRDGSRGVTRAHQGLVLNGGWLPRDARIVMQVSRWDRLKDMSGVLTAFADHIDGFPDDAHLLLVGPEVSAVSDDPEGAEVLEECKDLWSKLPWTTQTRTHLCCLPMDDGDENAHLVNALQRYATVVVQKSLFEGFGLTVTEPMWKSRPVVASAVGGIQDQIVDGVSGLLLSDPTDPTMFATAVRTVLTDQHRADEIGRAARERVRDLFLGDRHLVQYGELFEALVGH